MIYTLGYANIDYKREVIEEEIKSFLKKHTTTILVDTRKKPFGLVNKINFFKYKNYMNITNLEEIKNLCETYKGDIILMCCEKDINKCHRKKYVKFKNYKGEITIKRGEIILKKENNLKCFWCNL